MGIGDRLNDTVATQLQRGLPDGRNIDNMVNWYTAIGKDLHKLMVQARKEGKIEIRLTLFGIPMKLTVILPEDKE